MEAIRGATFSGTGQRESATAPNSSVPCKDLRRDGRRLYAVVVSARHEMAQSQDAFAELIAGVDYPKVAG